MIAVPVKLHFPEGLSGEWITQLRASQLIKEGDGSARDTFGCSCTGITASLANWMVNRQAVEPGGGQCCSTLGGCISSYL